MFNVPVSQVGVGEVVEVDSHWPVAEFKVPVLQVGVGEVVEVDSHWPVAEFKVPVSHVGSLTTACAVMG